MDDEVTPLLPQPDGIDLADYKRTLLQRFANPAISDGLPRLCRRGSAKMPHHLLPSLTEALTSGRPHQLLTLALAGWFRYLRGTDDNGAPLLVDDPHAEQLQALARAGGTDPRPLLGLRSLFGPLGDDAAFVDELQQALEQLERDGVHATLAASAAVPLR
jgi:fructuronate reductase/mannitol 2-dehydrogenase